MQVLEAVDDAAIDELSARDEFFWLDVVSPSPAALDGLAARFGWHPLVREDLEHFGQRPKLESYGDYMFIVFFGARFDDASGPALTEVHLVVSGSYVVSVRRAGCRELEVVHSRFRRKSPESEHFAVYAVMDALTDSFFPLLERIDDDIDRLEEEIARQPGDEELAEVFRLKRLIVELRRVVGPQRDLAARALDELVSLPGLEVAARDYFRDLYDHLLRTAERLDSYRDLLTSAMDVYLSTVSNRLNVVMKQLTLVATIFLPLTFVTGFFGQNFGWLTDHISSLTAFLVYGVGGYLLAVLVLYAWFRRQGFFD